MNRRQLMIQSGLLAVALVVPVAGEARLPEDRRFPTPSPATFEEGRYVTILQWVLLNTGRPGTGVVDQVQNLIAHVEQRRDRLGAEDIVVHTHPEAKRNSEGWTFARVRVRFLLPDGTFATVH